MLFIDAAIPSDVDPLVNDLEDAFVYSLDDLERIALEGRFQRDEAATEAEAIIETELREYVRAVAERVRCRCIRATAAFRTRPPGHTFGYGRGRPGGRRGDTPTRQPAAAHPSETLRKMVDPAAGKDAEDGKSTVRLVRRRKRKEGVTDVASMSWTRSCPGIRSYRT